MADVNVGFGAESVSQLEEDRLSNTFRMGLVDNFTDEFVYLRMPSPVGATSLTSEQLLGHANDEVPLLALGSVLLTDNSH